jgi:hypothetical protein
VSVLLARITWRRSYLGEFSSAGKNHQESVISIYTVMKEWRPAEIGSLRGNARLARRKS